MKVRKQWTHIASFGFSLALIASSAAIATQQPAAASSHREAPLISEDPVADNTDTYAFVSPDRPDSVTLIGSWIPLEHPAGGPNYYSFGDDVIYKLNVDTNGDAKPEVTYKFTFHKKVRNPNTFLYNVGPINDIRTDTNWNIPQTGTLVEVVNGQERTLATDFAVPPVNIGSKSTPDYEKLWKSAIFSIPTPEGDIKVFAGQTDDPFWVDLQVFDLLTLRGNPPPVGYTQGRRKPTDALHRFNVHSIAVQVPIAHLLKTAPSGESVIGVWATSERYSMRAYGGGTIGNTGTPVQISRLGMPLVNEAIIPLALKDAFNAIPPSTDYDLFTSGTPAGELLKKSVLNPELQNLLQSLYGVPHPSGDRTDLLAIFLTGMKTTKPFTIHTKNGDVTLPAGFNVNQPQNVRPAEMIRLNTAIKGDVCKSRPDRLGLLGGDACGFPNGRRLSDDVVEIELAAVAGAAYPVLTSGTFNFNPALLNTLNDHVDVNDKPFRKSFPYLATPWQGQEWFAGGGPNQTIYPVPDPSSLNEDDSRDQHAQQTQQAQDGQTQESQDSQP